MAYCINAVEQKEWVVMKNQKNLNFHVVINTPNFDMLRKYTICRMLTEPFLLQSVNLLQRHFKSHFSLHKTSTVPAYITIIGDTLPFDLNCVTYRNSI
jgi:hypothetical protein